MINPPNKTKNRVVLLFYILSIFLCVNLVFAGWFLPTGFILGDCYANANITITVYDEGFINNPGNIVDVSNNKSSSDGGYGQITGALADSTNYDINITAFNTSCSPSAQGSVALLSQTTGGPIDPPVQIDTNITITAPFYLVSPSNSSTTGNNETSFDWNSDYLSTTFNLLISNNSNFTILERNITGISNSNFDLNSSNALPDGTYYWRVDAISNGNTIDSTGYFITTISVGEAVLSNFNPGNNSWSGSTSETISFSTDKNAICKYATSSGVAFSAKSLFSTTGTTSHSGSVSLGSEGSNQIFVQCNATTSGNVNANDYVHTIRRDTTGPSSGAASVLIDGGNSSSSDTTLDFTWAGFTDAGIGISSYYYSFTNNEYTSTGTNDAVSPGTLSSASQGTVYVYVWSVDTLGNIGSAASDTIFVDTLPPSFSLWSSNPTDLTKYDTGNFIIYFTVTDVSALDITPQVRYNINNNSWSSWASANYVGSSGSSHSYSYVIPESASPNTWFENSGNYLYYEVFVNDSQGLNNTAQKSEFINNVSTAPVLNPISDKLGYEDTLLSFNITAYDVDLNSLTYTCNITGATVSNYNDSISTISYTPDNDNVGTSFYYCNVTDGTFISSQEFSITIINSNDDPVLESIGSLYAQEYVYFNYSMNASDDDGDSILYFSNSSFFSVGRSSGEIKFIPYYSNRGVYSINFSVQDPSGGIDFETVLFTVGYCGDDTCKSGFEDCSSCEADCGSCSTLQSKAIILEPRNCLDEEMLIQSVTLVARATCDVKGEVINGLEVCGNESDTGLGVYFSVGDSWEELTTLTTDEDGFASFSPSELGEYKVAFSSDADIFTLFEVSECKNGVFVTEESKSDKGKTSIPKTVSPPILEEPTIIEEVEPSKRWSFFAIILYFLIFPLLILGVVFSGTNYFYRFEKKKNSKSSFVKFVDKFINNYVKFKKKIIKWMNKTPPFNKLIIFLSDSKKKTSKWFTFIRNEVVFYFNKFLLIIGLKNEVKIPVYNIQSETSKPLHLLLISLVKFFDKKRNLEELILLIEQYKISSLQDLAILLVSFNFKVKLIDENVPPHLTMLLNKGLNYKQGKGTRVDIENSLHNKIPCICTINELGNNNTIFQSNVLVYAFSKENFYFHDYQRNKFNVKMSKSNFLKSWKAADSKVVLILDK